MRWIVYSLLLINIVLLTYFLTASPNDNESPSPYISQGKGKPLVLLSEQPAAPEGHFDDAAVEDQQSTYKSEKPKLCYALGPYPERVKAQGAQNRSLELGFTGLVAQHQVPTEKNVEFWVHIPPLADRAEALKLLRKLQSERIDSYIITQGDLANGISLGLFRKRDSAYSLRKKVAQLNFGEVAIRELGGPIAEYWLEVREISKLDEPARRRVKANDSDVAWQMVDCRHQSTDV